MERSRIVAAAQALLLERGLAGVALADVAIALRMPIAAVERQFPAGMEALVQASLETHLHDIHARLLTQRQECSSAVEELLAMHRLLQQQMGDTRSLFMREVAASYPALHGRLRELRATFTLGFLADNLRRGMGEGYYHPGLDADEQARRWLRLADEAVGTAATTAELTDGHEAAFRQFLASLTTPLGDFVARRLRETAPYY